MHGVDDVGFPTQMSGENTLHNVTCERRSIYFRKFTSIVDPNLLHCILCNLCCKTTQRFTQFEVRLQFVHHGWCNSRHVNCVFKRFVTQNVKHLFRHIDSHVLLCFYCGCTKVRRNDNAWVIQERVISGWRLAFKYVKCCTSNNTLINGFHKCHLVNYTTTSTVDDTHAFFHHFELWT
ncbi:hypothetical protein D3C76_1028440 [compost metagenome]